MFMLVVENYDERKNYEYDSLMFMNNYEHLGRVYEKCAGEISSW